jgi:hypothetical protein
MEVNQELCPQEATEISSHYKMRLAVFNRAFSDGKS